MTSKFSKTAANLPLNTCTVQQPRAFLSRCHMAFHFLAVAALLYYRISNLFHGGVPRLSWGLITLSEMIFTFIWVLTQPFRWLPVVRTVAPENLPGDEQLPGVDVFICTADPTKEPVIEVMNTVLSAMALDYPAEKLAVYLSDDGGAEVTLYAMKETCSFARTWLPFCRRFGIKSRCPEAYFSSRRGDDKEDTIRLNQEEFKAEEENIQTKYEELKTKVETACEMADTISDDRPPHIEVIYDRKMNQGVEGDECKLPLLVYVSREKRPSRPHRFKAGALNALLRVSGIMSNSPYVLVLDCDMYCNDPTSAKQAMCFHLDPKNSDPISYVQFPQIFFNVSSNDIYDGQARSAYKTKYQGMDGVRGTVCSGTGYYLKKKALYSSPDHEGMSFDGFGEELRLSPKFIESVKLLNSKFGGRDELDLGNDTIKAAQLLASCSYEQNTRWGKEIGYSYECLLESTFTGYLLHCKGWKSVYLYPDRPCFLGCTTIDMKDALVQLMKWASGLVQVGLSSFSPLTYGVSKMSILQSMCYAYFAFTHFSAVACLLYGIVPPISFLLGVPLYPKVTSPWFAAFATVFISSLAQHVYEVVSSGGSMRTVWNEQRIWMIKSVTACLFGCLDVLLKYVGVTKANFRLTNKAIDREKLDKYEKGKFEFEGAKMFMIPLTALVLLNLGCFIGGAKGLVSKGNVEEMFGQGLLSSYVLVLSLPILQGFVPKLT